MQNVSPESATSEPILANAALDPQRQEQARAYARVNRRLMLVDLALGAAYLLAWLAFGWSQALKAAILVYTSSPWLVVAVYAAVFGGIYSLIGLPLSYYEGFVLPHRFKLSNQTLRGWIVDLVKSALVGGALGLPLLEIIYAVLRAYPETWWLWAAGILLLFSVILANLAPALLMPIFYKFEPLGETYADLEARLLQLAQQAGARVQGVYRFDMSRRTKAANAALTGLGNTRRILLGDTLLESFTPDEIETVLAHELAHHVHRDIPIGILAESLVTLVGFYLASLALKWGALSLGFEGPADIAALPWFGLVMGAYGLVTMPLTNGYSRWRERRADEYALKATGKGAAYASALARLANQNLAEAEPEPWVEFLLYSHPALGKRIRMARRAAGESA
ncbi:MAG: M48 family metallopeptidase [Anaerolineales bacterium]|nr:M48 family metallopeptidase [Anaerolineales bacterium]